MMATGELFQHPECLCAAHPEENVNDSELVMHECMPTPLLAGCHSYTLS